MRPRKVQGTNAASEGGTFVLIALEFRGEGGTQRGGGPCKDHLSTGGVRFHDGEIMFTCEFLDFREVFGGSMLTGGILCSGERFASVLDLFTDVVGEVAWCGGSQVDADFNALIRIYWTDLACVSKGLPLTAGKLLVPLGGISVTFYSFRYSWKQFQDRRFPELFEGVLADWGFCQR